jgi:uncharacterized protein YbjT (DUF2867 family)
MILVVGATGRLGREICRRLLDAGEPVRALVRPTSDPVVRQQLAEHGAELVEGDLRNRASLDAACRAVEAVVSTATTTMSRQPGDSIEATDQAGQLALVDAARAAGVSRFVFISYSGHIPEADPLTRAKRSVERRLQESGMTYTILRPSIFMDVWLTPMFGFDYVNGRATVFGSGRNPISWVALGDVAAVAARSVRDRAAANASIDFGGPEALPPLDVVRIFEEAAGKHFEVQHVPEEALRAQEAAATDSLQQAFAKLQLAYARGDAHDNAGLRPFALSLRSVREYAAECLSGALAR